MSRVHRRILIVDSRSSVRGKHTALLSARGYKTLSAGKVDTALKLAQKQAPDLVLLDSTLTRGNGGELCRELRNLDSTRTRPLVLIVGCESPQDTAEMLADADDFLTTPVATSELLARVKLLFRIKECTEQLEDTEQVLFALASCVEARDRDTGDHCARLSQRALAIARGMGMSEKDCEAVRKAGFLHDLGKISIPDRILNKPGPLSADEWVLMRTHPETGERLCAPLKTLSEVLPIIRHHHERMNGTGYPDRLQGEQIPLTARVLQVADVFDALINSRPYKPAMTPDEALRTIEQEVNWGYWDGAVFDVLQKQIAGDGAKPKPDEAARKRRESALNGRASAVAKRRPAPHSGATITTPVSAASGGAPIEVLALDPALREESAPQCGADKVKTAVPLALRASSRA